MNYHSNIINFRTESTFPRNKIIKHIKLLLSKAGQNKKIAVFDFDNTMILGDIGDAAIALMLENEIEIGFSWSEYLELQRIGDVQQAFRLASNIFNGFEIDCIKRFANAIVNIENQEIVFFENDKVFKVQVPMPNPRALELIDILSFFNFEIHIISSSNHYLVSKLADKYFGISPQQVNGIKNKAKTFQDILVSTDQILNPVPIDMGKIEVYNKNVSKEPLLIFGGDSLYDIPLAKTVADDGIVFWFGSVDLTENLSNKKKIILL